MENYFAAKRLLFDGTVYPAPRVAVHQRARSAQRRRWPPPRAMPARRFGPMESARANGAPQATRSRPPARPSISKLPPARPASRSHLAGEVNILNLLAAFTAAHARGVSFSRSRRRRSRPSSPFPAASSPSMPASPSPSSSTTRTPTTRCATSPRSPAR